MRIEKSIMMFWWKNWRGNSLMVVETPTEKYTLLLKDHQEVLITIILIIKWFNGYLGLDEWREIQLT